VAEDPAKQIALSKHGRTILPRVQRTAICPAAWSRAPTLTQPRCPGLRRVLRIFQLRHLPPPRAAVAEMSVRVHQKSVIESGRAARVTRRQIGGLECSVSVSDSQPRNPTEKALKREAEGEGRGRKGGRVWTHRCGDPLGRRLLTRVPPLRRHAASANPPPPPLGLSPSLSLCHSIADSKRAIISLYIMRIDKYEIVGYV
jgi:hypothetical protein